MSYSAISSKPIPNTVAYQQRGFTLIELMISLVLGLLISAAALALFLDSTRNVRVQESAGDVQEAAVFNLTYLEKEMAMANLGAHRPMTASSPWTGIILSGNVEEVAANPTSNSPTLASFTGNLAGFGVVSDAILTRAAAPTSLSNIIGKTSDQLTIQYQAPFAMTDCEGNAVAAGQYVVERIFARQDATSLSNESPANKLSIALACEAGRYNLANNFSTEVSAENQYQAAANQLFRGPAPSSLDGGNGTIMVNRIDYFKVKLGVLNGNGIQYLDIGKYCGETPCKTLANITANQAQAPIVAVQIGVIVRSTNSIGLDTPTQFTVLGDTVNIDKTDNHYVRRVIEKTIRLKNGVLPAAS